MKKKLLILIILPAAILGFLLSCTIPTECYDYRAHMTPSPYSDTDYNSVCAIIYKYISGPIGLLENYDLYNARYIYSEDTTVLDQEIQVYGELSTCRDLQDPTRWRDHHTMLSNTVFISYDTSNLTIEEKLTEIFRSDERNHTHTTIYVKGRLRLFTTGIEENETYLCCTYMIPGIFIDSADDITLTPKRDEDN